MRFGWDREGGYWRLDITEHTFLHTINEWHQFFHPCNWYDFDIIHMVIENDVMCPGLDIQIIILGLGIRFRHNRSWEGTEIQAMLDEAKERIEEMKRDVPGASRLEENEEGEG